jgi:hypothetical protein
MKYFITDNLTGTVYEKSREDFHSALYLTTGANLFRNAQEMISRGELFITAASTFFTVEDCQPNQQAQAPDPDCTVCDGLGLADQIGDVIPQACTCVSNRKGVT